MWPDCRVHSSKLENDSCSPPGPSTCSSDSFATVTQCPGLGCSPHCPEGRDDCTCPSPASMVFMRIQKRERLLEPLERLLLGAFAIKFCCYYQCSHLPVVLLLFDLVVPALGSLHKCPASLTRFFTMGSPHPGLAELRPPRALAWATENGLGLSAARASEGVVATYSPSAS